MPEEDPKECCTWSDLCEKHQARISPELMALIESVDTEQEKAQMVLEYLISKAQF